jgi:hypothetical protein
MDSLLATVLYAVAGIALAVASLYLWVRERESASARWFVGTCVFLLAWLATLFFFLRSTDESTVLLLGRLNFAAASLAVYAVYRLVRAVANLPIRPLDRLTAGISIIFSILSAVTPWIDKAEIISKVGSGDNHETVYGFLFPLYALHIILMLVWAIGTAMREQHRLTHKPHVQDQLQLLGMGIIGTGAVSLVTNILLPYFSGNFRWISVGPFSTILLLLAVAYAVVRHQLFDIRIFLRRTLVLGMALSLVLACYSALVLLATDKLASSESGGVTRFGVLVLAFSFDPIRRFLEARIDKLLFSKKSSKF